MKEEVMFAPQESVVDPLNHGDDTVDAQKFLIFMCDDLRLGVHAESVVEILTHQPITYLPMLPAFIRGIINMRGQMIPIVDIRARLGKPSLQDCLVVVLNLGETQLGILVDAVDQMVDIPKANILPVPSYSTQLLVCGMCSLPDNSGTMMVLDCAQLMPHE